jgi:hypothetical protein
MKSLFFAIALLGLASTSATSAVESVPTAASCCNMTCVVCGKPVDKAVPTATFKVPADAKVSHPELIGASVGFCNIPCKRDFDKNPAAYEEKLYLQWQETKNTLVK